MTMNEGVEQRLERIFAPTVSPNHLAEIDARVAAAVAVAEPGSGSRFRSARRVAVVGLAALILVGVVGAGLDAFQRILGSAGWQTAWQRAEHVGVSTTANGHEVILEGVYADAGQVVVGVSSPTMADLLNYSGIWVTDESGREFQPTGGTGTTEEGRSVLVYGYFPEGPLPAGEQEFEITMRSNGMADPWEFALPVTVQPAETLELDLAATTADITFHLGEVIISPTIVRLQVSVDEPSTRTDRDWAPIATLRHNGAELNLNGGEPEMFSARGVDDPSGHWELVVTELVGGEIDGEQVRVQGPWTLTFEVP